MMFLLIALTVFSSSMPFTVGIPFDANMFGKEFVLSFYSNGLSHDMTGLRILNNLKDNVAISTYNASSGSVDSRTDTKDEIIERFLQTICTSKPHSSDCIVVIESQSDVKVTVMDAKDGNIFYFVLPLDKLRDEYIMATHSLPSKYTCDLITVQPSTHFHFSAYSAGTITFTNESLFCYHGNCQVPVVNKYSILRLRSSNDMTGLFVTGDKRFAVFCGGTVSAGRIFLNQVLPTGMYGSSYQTSATLFTGFVSMISRYNDTRVDVYGSQNQSCDLDAGGHCQQIVLPQEVRVISSNKPIMVMQSWSMRHALHRMTLVPLIKVDVNHTCTDHVTSTQMVNNAVTSVITTRLSPFTSRSPTATVHVSPSICTCPCRPKVTTVHSIDLESKIQELRKLSVNKSTLSSTIRKRISAYDGRSSARGIGIIGVALLCGVVVFIVVLDMPNLLAQLRLVRLSLSSSWLGPTLECNRNRLIHVQKSESTHTIIVRGGMDQTDC